MSVVNKTNIVQQPETENLISIFAQVKLLDVTENPYES